MTAALEARVRELEAALRTAEAQEQESGPDESAIRADERAKVEAEVVALIVADLQAFAATFVRLGRTAQADGVERGVARIKRGAYRRKGGAE